MKKLFTIIVAIFVMAFTAFNLNTASAGEKDDGFSPDRGMTPIMVFDSLVYLQVDGIVLAGTDIGPNTPAKVVSVGVRYPDGWELVSVQQRNDEQFVVTMKMGKDTDRHVTFRIDLQSKFFRQLALDEARWLLGSIVPKIKTVEVAEGVELNWRPYKKK